MWNSKECPICRKTIVNIEGDMRGPRITSFECLTMVHIFGNYERSHFRTEYRDGEPFYEVMIIFPYKICSYNDVSNIYIYNNMESHFIIETKYLNLTWNDQKKILNKLSIYTLFS
jgi:hypothetical protein